MLDNEEPVLTDVLLPGAGGMPHRGGDTPAHEQTRILARRTMDQINPDEHRINTANLKGEFVEYLVGPWEGSGQELPLHVAGGNTGQPPPVVWTNETVHAVDVEAPEDPDPIPFQAGEF